MEPSSQSAPTQVSPGTHAEWDGWPDGPIERFFSYEEIEAIAEGNSTIPVHWSCHSSGASKGSLDAETAQDGRTSERRCWGAIICDNPACDIVDRPKTRLVWILAQLKKKCICGASLHRVGADCPTRQVLSRFKHGIQFTHKGYHDHPRPSHQLHLSAKERSQFKDLVEKNPNSGPLQLLVGVPTLHGPGESAVDISPVLINKDRITYERKRVRQGTASTNSPSTLNLDEFIAFCQENKGFVVQSVTGPDVVVISMQQPLMLAELVKETRVTSDDPVNGIVSDAAHGFWLQRNCLLVISSGYSHSLHCWIPGILSYTNGATQEHYHLHFLALFKSIASELQRRGLDTSSDKHFGNVRISVWCLLVPAGDFQELN